MDTNNFTCEYYWRILQSNIEFVKFSDQKAGSILTVYGVVLPILYSNSSELIKLFSTSPVQLFLGSMSGLCAIISITFSFLCLNPRLSNFNPHSIIFFGQIAAHKNFRDYIDHSNKIISNETEFANQIAEQVYVNAQVASQKFKNVSWSIRFFFSFLVVLFLAIINGAI